MLTYCHRLFLRQLSHRVETFMSRGAASMPAIKAKFSRDKPHVNVGTIGHVDHGKTTLTSAITKVLSNDSGVNFKRYEEIDHLPEEKNRGITIRAAHVEYQTGRRHYAHIDCPGHIDYVKNMITGTFQMDGVILVLAANHGVMPQTREHIILTRQIGVSNLIVFINKVDLVDEASVHLCELEIREMLSDYGFDGEQTPIISGSAKLAIEERRDDLGRDSILRLLQTLDEYISLPIRNAQEAPCLAIDGIYSIQGRGTVVSGVLEQGRFRSGDTVLIKGYDRTFKSVAVSIETFHKSMIMAEPGDNVGILLRGMKRRDIKKGMIVAKPGLVSINNRIVARVYLLRSDEGGLDEPIMNDQSFQLYSRTYRISANVTILSENTEMVMPGDETEMELMLYRRMYIPSGTRFTLRSQSLTVGYGIVTYVNDDADEDMLRRRWPKLKILYE